MGQFETISAGGNKLQAEFINLFNIVLEAIDKKSSVRVEQLYQKSDNICAFLIQTEDETGKLYRCYDIIPKFFSMWMYTELSEYQSSDNPSEEEFDFLEKINERYFSLLEITLKLLYLIETKSIDQVKDVGLKLADNVNSAIDYLIIKLKLERDLLEASRSHIVSGEAFRKAASETVTAALNELSERKSEEINQLAEKMKSSIEEEGTKRQNKLTEDIEAKANKLSENIDKQGTELTTRNVELSMTILGVFVGIVMVFFGGFSILENAISGISSVSAYRLYFTMLMFGLILFDVVIVLFYIISRIANKTITCECPKSKDNKCVNCSHTKRLKFICRFKNTMPYVYWGNVGMMTGLLFIFLLKEFSPNNALAPVFSTQTLPALVTTVAVVAIFFLLQHFILGKGK